MVKSTAAKRPESPLSRGRVCGHVRMREGALPEWAETRSGTVRFARSTRPARDAPNRILAARLLHLTYASKTCNRINGPRALH